MPFFRKFAQVTFLFLGLLSLTAQNKDAYQQLIADYMDQPSRYSEPWRAQYHFSPIKGWMNDPNGLFYKDGVWHLGYQHHIGGITTNTSWGYATSTDLLHWEHHPPMLYGKEGLAYWSGGAFVDHNNTSGLFDSDQGGVIAYYTIKDDTPEAEAEKGFQYVHIAYSNDDGKTWTDYDKNPIIPKIDTKGNRDPKVFYYDKTRQYYLILCEYEAGRTPIYASANLIDWQEVSAIDTITECPDLFPLPVNGDPNTIKWVFSRSTRYFDIGEFDGKTFTPQRHQIANYGIDNVAGQSFDNAPGHRRVMISWMMYWNYGKLPLPNAGGHQTLITEITLKEDREGLKVLQNPIEEYETLRENKRVYKNIKIQGKDNLDNLRGKSIEIIAELDGTKAEEIGFEVFSDARGSQKTKIGYDTVKNEVFVDRNESTTHDFKTEKSTYYQDKGRYAAPVSTLNGKRVKLHLFLDHSTVEVFVNDGEQVINSIVFPDMDSDFIKAYTKGGTGKILNMEVYDMQSIWR